MGFSLQNVSIKGVAAASIKREPVNLAGVAGLGLIIKPYKRIEKKQN